MEIPQLGEHIREFWTETPASSFPMIELAAANGQLYVTIMQSFSARLYYDALLEELKEQGIPYTEYGEQLNGNYAPNSRVLHTNIDEI